MTKLPAKDADHFLRLFHSLIFYVNRKYDTIKELKSPDALFKKPIKELCELKEHLYSDPEILDSFVKENPMGFSSEDLEIIESWKDFVKSSFLIMGYRKDYSIFLDPTSPPKAYGVLGLRSSFEEMMGSNLPSIAETTLLPYKDKIIYDGTILSGRVIFGRSIRESFKLDLDRAKELYGIITQLPLKQERRVLSDMQKLDLYLKTKHSRDVYHYEIQDLIAKDPELMTRYCQAMGKIDAQTFRRKLKDIGLKRGWFAILRGIIVAGGRSQAEVEMILNEILSDEIKDRVYIFNIK